MSMLAAALLSQDAETPLVQVIMPARNRERYVGEAIESVISQADCSFVLDVVVNASNDATYTIARDFAARDDSPVRATYTARKGASHARNLALSMSDAPFVAFVDSDDRLSPLWLAKMVRSLDGQPAQVIGAYSEGFPIDESGKRLPRTKTHNDAKLYFRPPFVDFDQCMLHAFPMTGLGMVLFRREAFAQPDSSRPIRFDPRLPRSEDIDLIARVLDADHSRGFVHVDSAHYLYRRHGQRTPEQQREQYLIIDALMSRYVPKMSDPTLRYRAYLQQYELKVADGDIEFAARILMCARVLYHDPEALIPPIANSANEIYLPARPPDSAPLLLRSM